jgi:outer membrane protein assembly factor BamB
MPSKVIYLGVKAHVVAVNKTDGTELWRTKLKGRLGDRFVTLFVEEARVYAHTYGELFCLDAATGGILWRNRLEGLSFDIASIASEGSSQMIPAAVYRRKKQSDGGGGDGGGGD